MINNKISICIPTYEQKGKGVLHLKELLESIKQQTYQNINIIVSDHSTSDEIKKVCNSFSQYLDILHIFNSNNIGNSSSNTNNAIRHADGNIIKIIFQDDFLFSPDALFLINMEFQKHDCYWAVCGCNHTIDGSKLFHKNMIPIWNDKIILGQNTISSPSVLSFRKECDIYFDEQLIILMDCEIYYRFYKKYGKPNIISDILITNRIHKNQISKRYYFIRTNKPKELNYIKNKFSIK